MHTSTNVYGMKDPRGRVEPNPSPICTVPADHSAAYIVLSITEIALAGVFAIIPLFWSIQYRIAARRDPQTPIQNIAKVTLVLVGGIGAVVNVVATFLWLLAQAP